VFNHSVLEKSSRLFIKRHHSGISSWGTLNPNPGGWGHK
jgi:hypothetical protein